MISTHPSPEAIRQPASAAGLRAAQGSDVRPEIGQLSCPKCRALTLNIHVSDIIRDNGRVTCSHCGHERVVMKLTNEQRLKRQGMIFNHDGKCGKIIT
jgi:transposase-like protein